MLNILTGRAGEGKTRQIMSEIKQRMTQGETGIMLIVPEQYSHDAERQLCDVCGDTLSLHAEVLSFTRLCRHVFSETGTAGADDTEDSISGAFHMLDKSGQILIMHRALESVLHTLKVFGIKKTRTQILESLLAAINEFRSMCLTSEEIDNMAQEASIVNTPLSDKLRDFALIMSAYEALLERYGGDAALSLSLLAEKIKDSSVGNTGHIYFDGFNDFTAQEMRIIEELLKKGAEITVCLTCEPDPANLNPGYSDIFEIPNRTISQLRRLSASVTLSGIDGKSRRIASNRVPELMFLEKHLFDDSILMFNETDDITHGKYNHPVSVYAAPSRYTECEYAAAIIWNMVRSGSRWRDIAVMARDFSGYETICEHVFTKYGIPYFTSGRVDIQSKPPIALINTALEIATQGWEYKYVFKYLKTGLLPFEPDEVALLENYVLKWNIRGSLWQRQWVMPPSGYPSGYNSQNTAKTDGELLIQLNNMRERIVKPLIRLRDGIKGIAGESYAGNQLRSLYDFLIDISLPEKLHNKAAVFASRGELRLADEYTQLSDIIIEALDQMYTVLGNSKLTAIEFKKLISLVLSQHTVGVIPIALDRVPLGDMAMSRRRDLKCLIILGATDENLPKLAQGSGVLSDNERRALYKINRSIPSGIEERLYREMNMIYSSITLPSEKLVMIYEASGKSRPSYILKRMCGMFAIDEITLSEEEYMSEAAAPYFELRGRTEINKEIITRTHLSPHIAKNLYGSNMSLSATRVEGYYSCPYKYFLQTGLKLKQRRPAEFDAAQAGSYIHYVLDGVFGELGGQDKIPDINDNEINNLALKYSKQFIRDILLDFEGKNTRFKYLFRRYEQNMLYVVKDMLDELKKSKFKPFAFEMDISKLTAAQRGFIDRVDIYEKGNKIFLRIVDYKTRKKAYNFDINDVLHGKDMQMLIYLFALEKYGKELFAKEIQSAGVMYIPARDVIINVPRDADDEQINILRDKEMRRSGLIINDSMIIEAMESGENKKYLPVKADKDGDYKGDSLISTNQFKVLAAHVGNKVENAKKEILSGINDCTPFYKNMYDNACMYCRYQEVCRFDEKSGDKRKYIEKLKTEEVWQELTKQSKHVQIP